mgnify:FL=1|jgi:16S rRNA (cytidine1402-2'-O)-methyltransferase
MRKNKTGTLYIVATPIGHNDDITLRAIEILKKVDIVICEELRQGSTLLKRLKIKNNLIPLNEHNENEMVQNILVELLNGKNMALISDCGTPVFSDPGRKLLQIAYESSVPVRPVPGTSSLMAAISICPLNLDQFTFAGFLPPQSTKRLKVLRGYSHSPHPIILMDTPYRLGKLLNECGEIFGRKQTIFLACNMTQSNERNYLGTIEELLPQLENTKSEFILIVDKPQRRRQR